MMSLWAPGAVFDIDQQTLTGKPQIRHWFATENKAFMPRESLGVRHSHIQDEDLHLFWANATFYFECHYIDPSSARWSRSPG